MLNLSLRVGIDLVRKTGLESDEVLDQAGRRRLICGVCTRGESEANRTSGVESPTVYVTSSNSPQRKRPCKQPHPVLEA